MYFVSHSSKDAECAQSIVRYLEAHQIKCWIAPRDITPGSSYPSQIISAIRGCDGFILVASNHVNQSNHINSEVARAFDLKKRIYPFLVDSVKFSDDYIYYLGLIQWINAYDDFEKGLSSLREVIMQCEKGDAREKTASPTEPKMMKVKVPSVGKDGIGIASYQDLVSLGYTALDISRRLVENDYNLYPGMTAENEGEPEQWAEYLSTYPDTFRYLINQSNEIIGNWSFLAVSEEVHAAKLAAGELTEDTFSLDETEYLLFPGDYVGYLLNLSVNPEYNNPRNLNLLLNAFTDQMTTFAEEGIFFKSWYVNVFRRDHEAMYRRLGFSYLLDNKNFGKLYFLDCSSPAQGKKSLQKTAGSLFASSSRLREMYHEHFV